MRTTLVYTLSRILSGSGEAVRTPSGVRPDSLRLYGPRDERGIANYYGNEC